MDCIDHRLLLKTDRFNLTQDDPETAAELLHVSQLVVFHLLFKALLLHDDIDELLLTVDTNAKLRINVLLAL